MASNEKFGNSNSVGLKEISEGLAAVVAAAAPFVVRVEDGSHLTGTGVVWTDQGIIVTSSHGLERDEDLTVETDDGSVHAVTLIGRDPQTDIAVLKTDAAGLTFAPKAAESAIKVGHLVVALGRPGRMGLQATIGLINSIYEVETNGQPEYILKTDAALYPGFSGGPLVSAGGEVVGIVNRQFGRGSSVALGVPIVDLVVTSLLEHGQVKRGYLGIRTQIVPLPASIKDTIGRDQESGLLIVLVEPGSPAELAGILLGDTLVGIDSTPLTDVGSLRRHLGAGKTVLIQTIRGGQPRDVEAAIVAVS
jgi:S1-C subfamily serine protease